MWYKYLHLTSIERTALTTSQLHGYSDDESSANSLLSYLTLDTASTVNEPAIIIMI